MNIGSLITGPATRSLRLEGGEVRAMMTCWRALFSVKRESEVHADAKWTVRIQAPALFAGSQQAPHRKNAPTGHPPLVTEHDLD